MPIKRLDQRGYCALVYAREQFRRRRSGEDFIEKNREVFIRHHIEPQRRLAHFPHALTQRRDMLGAVVRVQGKGHLQLIDRLGSEAREEDFVQPFEGIVITLQPSHAFLDGKAGPLRLVESREAGERREIMQGTVARRIHAGSMRRWDARSSVSANPRRGLALLRQAGNAEVPARSARSPPERQATPLQPHVEALLALESPTLRALAIELLVKLKLKVPADKAALIVSDAKVPANIRLGALRLLAAQNPTSPQLASILENWLAAAPGDEPALLRSEALRMIAARNPPRAIAAALAFLAKGEIAEQQTAWAVLGAMQSPEADTLIATALGRPAIPAAQLDLLEAAAARAPKSPVIAQALARFEKDRAAQTEALVTFTECLEGGDAQTGREIALQNVAANCVACHRFDGDGGSEVGPALIGVASRGDRRFLLDSLIAPGAKVTMGYGIVSVTKKSGDTISGTHLGEKDDTLRVRLPDGKEITIGSADIAAQTPPISMMPPMGALLSKRQIRDVVAYLGTLKAKK